MTPFVFISARTEATSTILILSAIIPLSQPDNLRSPDWSKHLSRSSLPQQPHRIRRPNHRARSQNTYPAERRLSAYSRAARPSDGSPCPGGRGRLVSVLRIPLLSFSLPK